MRQLSTVLELAGLTAVAAGAFTISTTVGLIVAGAAAFGVGLAMER